MIEKKVIKSKDKTVYIAKLDDMEEECWSKALAEDRVKQWEITKAARNSDMIIAEHLFGREWVNWLGTNYLITPAIFDSVSYNTTKGKNPNFKVNGILTYNMADLDWNPPKYDEPQQFLNLYTALIKRFVNIKFVILKDYVICELECDGKSAAYSKVDREKEYWADEYLIGIALRDAAAEYCEINIKQV